MNDNFRASLLMVLAMAGFAVEDLFIKAMTATLPVGQILFLIAVGSCLVFGCLLAASGQGFFNPAYRSGAFILRNVTDVGGFALGTVGLSLVPLTLAASVLQAAPLLVTLGAALFLRESVGWRRWAAVIVGLIGVMLILRPGTEAFKPAALFVLVGTMMMAARDLATRVTPRTITTLQMIFWANFLAVLGGLVVSLAMGQPWVLPAAEQVFQIAVAVVLGVSAYYALLVSLRMGEASAVVPFRYTRLVFALILGTVVLGERPDGIMLLGAAIVIASGIYTILREARLRRRERSSPVVAARL